MGRFPGMPKEFYDDWVQVAREETLHFGLLEARLKDLGSSYGSLPTHDGILSPPGHGAGIPRNIQHAWHTHSKISRL
jgi:uncharacterized ferritin-like protein (DUF455 family)